MPYKNKEKQREYQRKWIAQRRQDWIDANGPCPCGSSDRLEVDHIDRKLKTLEASWIWSRSQKVREKELANCQVLCYDCHLEKTISEIEITSVHGTHSKYHMGCRCILCKNAHKLAMREWRKAKK